MIKNYRSEIDGLRAIAVIPVIFFHAGFNFFDGGFVGVDVFFVISGYLITTIIINELNNNTFSLKKFYERRARRILPALIFVILVSYFISFILLTPSELASYFKSVIATLFFFSNYYFYKTTPYFVSTSELEPLLHTWSLSIEEQFYVIFPITLLLFYKFLKQYIFLLFIFSFFSSLFIAQFLAIKTGGTLNFYFTLSRAWELALGAICAHILIHKKIFFSKLVKNLLSLIGVVLIIFSVFFINKETIYPSFYALYPTIGTALIILFADEDTLLKKILSIKFFVYIGLVSYSLYLWHQPVLAFGTIFFENFSTIKKLIFIVLSFFLSIFSFNFIEQFFRNKNKIKFKDFFKTGIITIIFLTLFSYLNFNYFSHKFNSEIFMAKLLLNNDAIYATRMDERKFIKNRIIYENLNPKTLIIGSSRVMQISKENFDHQILNLGVSGASIEDHIAITLMALEKFNIDSIFLGADPWLFNEYNNQSRWSSIKNEYLDSLKNINFNTKDYTIIKINKNNEKNYTFYEIFLQKFYKFLNIRKLYIKTYEGNYISKYKNIILRDGNRIYRSERVALKLEPNIIKYSMDKYQFSKKNYEIYKKFIEHLINVHKKEVILFLPPYYPPSYRITIKEKPYYLDLENKFIELAKQTNTKIIGSYDGSLVPCNEDEFFDYMHPKGSCIKKIIDNFY